MGSAAGERRTAAARAQPGRALVLPPAQLLQRLPVPVTQANSLRNLPNKERGEDKGHSKKPSSRWRAGGEEREGSGKPQPAAQPGRFSSFSATKLAISFCLNVLSFLSRSPSHKVSRSKTPASPGTGNVSITSPAGKLGFPRPQSIPPATLLPLCQPGLGRTSQFNPDPPSSLPRRGPGTAPRAGCPAASPQPRGLPGSPRHAPAVTSTASPWEQ